MPELAQDRMTGDIAAWRQIAQLSIYDEITIQAGQS